MHSHVHTAMDYKGIVGQVSLGGVDVVAQASGWAHSVGLLGEQWQAWTNESLPWSPCVDSECSSPLTWLRTSFALDPLAQHNGRSPYETMLLDLNGMGRGHFYLNGHDLGKYWLVKGPSGKPTQRYYHLPADILRFGSQNNELVLGEQLGASDISSPRVVVSSMQVASELMEETII